MSKQSVCLTKIPSTGELEQGQASGHGHTPEHASRLGNLANRGIGRLAVERYFLWNPGSTIRVKFLNGSSQLQAEVASIASTWLNYANLRLEFFAAGPAEIRVAFNRGGGHWSLVGTACRYKTNQNEQTMNLDLNWISSAEERGVVLHEFGHALGCVHEHQSPRANLHWRANEVYSWFARNAGWTQQQTYNQVMKPFQSSGIDATDFHSHSIMMYPLLPEFTEEGYRVGWPTKLSFTDIAYISQVYPGRGEGRGGGGGGGNINARDDKGKTALHLAAEAGDESKVRSLLKGGASCELQEYVFGYTPLHTAVWYRHPRVVLILLRHGARKDVKTKAGYTALGLATLWKYNDIMELLQG